MEKSSVATAMIRFAIFIMFSPAARYHLPE
jgi:hypothetical protein